MEGECGEYVCEKSSRWGSTYCSSWNTRRRYQHEHYDMAENYNDKLDLKLEVIYRKTPSGTLCSEEALYESLFIPPRQMMLIFIVQLLYR